MGRRSISGLCVVASAVLALAMSSWAADPVAAADKAASAQTEMRPIAERPNPFEGSPGSARIEKFMRQALAEKSDPLAMCSTLFALSPDNKTKVEQLGRERDGELEKLRDDLNAQYADRSKALLDSAQGKQFEAALQAVAKYRKSLDAALGELAELGAPELPALAKSGSLSPRLDLFRYVGMTGDQTADERELGMELLKQLASRSEAIPRPTGVAGGDAMREYGDKVRQLREQNNVEFEKKRLEILTQEQRDKLARLDEGVKEYRQKAQEAEATLLADMSATFETKGAAPTPPGEKGRIEVR